MPDDKGSSILSFAGKILPPLGAGIAAYKLGRHLAGGDQSPSGQDGASGDKNLDPLLKTLQDQADSTKAKSQALAGQGQEALGPVLEYFKKLVGGDQQELLAATRPERARVIDQYDTARKTISQFGGRGGGANAALAGSQFSEANELSNITAMARTNAANSSAQIGETLTGLGLSADQLATADLNSVVSAILNKKYLDVTKSGQKAQLAGGITEGLGTLLGLYLTRKGGPWERS